jgi:hypothetical protein
MEIKVFSFKKPFFSWWDIPTAQMENEVENWLLKNPDIRIMEIRHDRFQGIWVSPQLIVTIYYEKVENRG